MFEIDRTFSYRNFNTGLMDWFFYAREGIYGPYRSKEQAAKCLAEFIKACIEAGDDGGRTQSGEMRLSMVPKEYSVVAKHYDPFGNDPFKRKRGVESFYS